MFIAYLHIEAFSFFQPKSVIHKKENQAAGTNLTACLSVRAVGEARTRDPQLGKLMLYQLSYYRDWNATKVIIRYNIRKEICCARFYPR